MKHIFSLFILAILFCYQGFGQNTLRSDSLVFSAKILDKESAESIPYATIYNQTKGKGTVGSLSGTFSLDGISINDTLVISFVAYKRKHIIVKEAILPEVIYLSPETNLLDEVVISADNSFLYELLDQTKRTETKETKSAKTYYVLKSMVGSKQVELVESYYNGEFAGYDAEKLDLKNGRIALTEFDKRFFVSTESSRAMYMHKLFEKNAYFPTSPFELSKRKMRKSYRLSLVSKYLDNESSAVYVIDFTPKEAHGEYFSGRVWLDSLHKRVIKVDLIAKNTSTHPFSTHGHAKRFNKVAIDIRKTYQLLDGQSYVKSIDFNYQIAYETTEDSLYTVNTNAVLYAYDYFKLFEIPKFNFSGGSYEDYRKINASPYNHFFWDNIQEFGMQNIRDENSSFIENSSSITNQTLFLNNPFLKKGVLEHPYVYWSENRIKFRESPAAADNYKKYAGSIPSDRYHLEAQIYLDINEFNDSLNILTKTIIDPFKSYFYFPLSNEGMAFINIYFDLVEIQRRELEQAIQKEKDKENIIRIYEQKTAALDRQIQQYFKEVEHGTNNKSILKWNELVKSKLGIDNLALFESFIMK